MKNCSSNNRNQQLYIKRQLKRCENQHCQKILILKEKTHCGLCAGVIAIYGKEAA